MQSKCRAFSAVAAVLAPSCTIRKATGPFAQLKPARRYSRPNGAWTLVCASSWTSVSDVNGGQWHARPQAHRPVAQKETHSQTQSFLKDMMKPQNERVEYRYCDTKKKKMLFHLDVADDTPLDMLNRFAVLGRRYEKLVLNKYLEGVLLFHFDFADDTHINMLNWFAGHGTNMNNTKKMVSNNRGGCGFHSLRAGPNWIHCQGRAPWCQKRGHPAMAA